ncbi:MULTISPECIES: alpha/beta fold hydrolase [Actinoalloteichus]|uniref:Hydrolase or acyltransferase of alpha/beta superfamily n=1 Tax=Actinoalloteichus fjordicus TaxID=1612552 RepID=A0AAC9LJA9_9PSEU|nr:MULTISPECIES: alpha/beta hydrolase [Actinoalloteichus]APU17799.1 putative hydrolase or acyltransferase of alpha/beta superfamily [Actinoalloteichus fjordicus]APU23878.1 putative hydrolase or acyltransferase of alpha/beta superfamily [Actinoalloteichus sp. GBA129-24]
MQLMRLSDGRDLEYEISGPEVGPVVLVHHGMPGSAVPMGTILDPLIERGYRMLTYSRAGHGESTPSPGRTVADSARDCGQLLDRLGISEYLSFGWSAGGPHALASAAVDAGRVVGVLTSASFAPFNAPGLDFIGGMGVQNQISFRSVERGEQAMREVIDSMSAAMLGTQPEGVADELNSVLPDVDVAAMQSAFGVENAVSVDHALRLGNEGWVADLAALTRPWGFDLDEIKAPVELWHGDLDKMVPLAHGKWLASNLNNVVSHLEAGHGHLSLTVDNLGRMLDLLASRAR